MSNTLLHTTIIKLYPPSCECQKNEPAFSARKRYRKVWPSMIGHWVTIGTPSIHGVSRCRIPCQWILVSLPGIWFFTSATTVSPLHTWLETRKSYLSVFLFFCITRWIWNLFYTLGIVILCVIEDIAEQRAHKSIGVIFPAIALQDSPSCIERAQQVLKIFILWSLREMSLLLCRGKNPNIWHQISVLFLYFRVRSTFEIHICNIAK